MDKTFWLPTCVPTVLSLFSSLLSLSLFYLSRPASPAFLLPAILVPLAPVHRNNSLNIIGLFIKLNINQA